MNNKASTKLQRNNFTDQLYCCCLPQKTKPAFIWIVLKDFIKISQTYCKMNMYNTNKHKFT